MFKKITRSTLTALGLLPLALFSDDVRAEQSADVFASSRVVAQLQYGKKTPSGQLDLLMPFYGDASQIWYGNVQGYQYGSTYRTFGLGFGNRQIINDAIYGVYGFFDRQTSANKINYNRYNVGLERLGQTWDFRTNFYLYANSGVTNLADKGVQSASINGNQILYAHLYTVEKAYNGADIEVGRTLGMDNVRGYLGYYNFGDVIKGPKARIEYQVNPRVALSASTQTDTRGWLTYAGISYWFGKTTLPGATGIETRMLDPVVRDMTVAETTIDSYIKYDVDPRSIYFAQPVPGGVAGTELGVGTASNPYSLQQAIATANDNDIIYLLGSDIPFVINDGITLKPGQTLWSSTQDLYAKGFLIKAAAPTAQPVTLIGGGITVTNGATLNGFSVDGTTGLEQSQSGITINGTAAVTINDVSVTNFNYDGNSAGINVLGAAPVTLTNVISNSNGTGLNATAGTITIDGTTNSFQNNTKGAGIYLADSAKLVSITNTNTSGNHSDGINLGGTSTYTNTLFSNITSNSNGDNGMIVTAPVTISASNLVVNRNGNGGLNVSNGTMSIAGTAANNSTFNNNTGAGIYVQNTGKLDTVQYVTTSNNTGNGIALEDTSTYTAALTNVTSTTNGLNGIKVNNPNATVNATTLVGDSNALNGLAISAGSVSVTSTGNDFSSNTLGGVAVSGTGALTSLQNATVSNNKAGDGISLAGTGTFSTALTEVITNTNAGNGININNPNATVNISDITSNGNTNGSGMWINQGVVNDVGSTANSFQSNSQYGVLAGSQADVAPKPTPTSGSLRSLTNANTSSNQYSGILLNNSNTDTVTLSNITSNTSVTGRGLWILQAGNVNIVTANLSSNLAASGLNISNSKVVVTGQNITSNSNGFQGLKLIHGTVTITGNANYFNTNGSDGVYVNNSDSILTLTANVVGNTGIGVYLGLENPTGKIQFISSVISGNTLYGLAAQNINEVDLYNTSISSAANSTMNIVGSKVNVYASSAGASSIISTGTRAIQVSSNSTVNITDPNITLKGVIIAPNAGDTSTISISVLGGNVITGGIQTKTCNIVNGVGPCN